MCDHFKIATGARVNQRQMVAQTASLFHERAHAHTRRGEARGVVVPVSVAARGGPNFAGRRHGTSALCDHFRWKDRLGLRRFTLRVRQVSPDGARTDVRTPKKKFKGREG